jgi:hypothetical protein
MSVMGRHARGVTRSRVPIATAVLGVLIVVVIAGGSWLSSRSQSAPAAASLTTGSAVVLSSLACTDGAGGTVVEVLSPSGGPAARATLDGCGYQAGQQLVVQYPLQDPTQVSLAGTTTADPVLDQSPFGILLAGLLVVGAAVAVGVARRRSQGVPTAAVPAAAVLTAAVAGVVSGGPTRPPGGRHARADSTDTEPDGEPPAGGTPPGPFPPMVDQSPTVDLVFPFASSLAASLRDELFTHRSLPT